VSRPARAVPWLALPLLAGALAAQEAPTASRGEATATQKVFGQVLANELKAPLVRTESLTVTAQVGPERWVEGRGPVVTLEGLEVSRLQFRHPTEASLYLAEVLRPERAPLVATLRGAQVVLLSGARLQAPKRAARVLQVAWEGEVLPTPEEALEALKVASPTAREGVAAEVAFESLTLLGTKGTRAYQGMLARLEAAREHQSGARPLPPAAELRFLAPDHFTFALRSERGSSFSELKATAQGAGFAVAEQPQRARVLLVWARELLAEWAPAGEAAREMRELAGALHAGEEEPRPPPDPGKPGQ
jgi:hypothetical protein